MINEKYVLGMVVEKGDSIGIIEDVCSGDNDFEGKKASVKWLDGNCDSWYELDDLQILENPLEKYYKAYTERKVVMTSDTGKERSCSCDSLDWELRSFLRELGASEEAFEDADDFIEEWEEDGVTSGTIYYYEEEDDSCEHEVRIRTIQPKIEK